MKYISNSLVPLFVLLAGLSQLLGSFLNSATDFDAGYFVDPPIYFLPASFTFSIWGVLILSMIGYSIYQFLPAQQERAIHKLVRKRIAVINVFFTVWLLAAVLVAQEGSLQIAGLNLTVLIIVTMLYILTCLFADTQMNNEERKEKEHKQYDAWLIDFPISAYLAWICVATVANVTDSLYRAGFTGGSYGPFWMALIIVVVTLIALLVLKNARRQAGIIGFSGVILWALFGLFLRNSMLSMLTTLFIAGAFLLVAAYAVMRLIDTSTPREK